MNLNFKSLIQTPDKVSIKETKQLDAFLKQYPYCHIAQILYLKGLQNQKSFLYNSHLKKASVYSPNRDILFNYITKLSGKTIKAKPLPNHKKKSSRLKDPLAFQKKDIYTFNEWLNLTNLNKIKRTKEPKKELIKTFLKNPSPRINLSKEDCLPLNIAEISITKNSSLATETLANIYEKQKLWAEAINAYEILCLKYPEKSSFFAAKIKKIKNLI